LLLGPSMQAMEEMNMLTTERQERALTPCGAERPFVVVAREEIMWCRGSVSALEAKLVAAPSSETGEAR